jgi:hypothetical protein
LHRRKLLKGAAAAWKELLKGAEGGHLNGWWLHRRRQPRGTMAEATELNGRRPLKGSSLTEGSH